MTETPADSNAAAELRMRVASAVVLIAVVILAVIGGSYAFAILVAVGAGAALFEWHRLVNASAIGREIVPSVLTLLTVIGLAVNAVDWEWSVAVIFAGALLTAVAAGRHSWVLWHSVGVIYVGIPVLSLIALREEFANGGYIVVGIFIAVWAADSAALFVGRYFGGPRLAPHLSPKKTWAGLIGGIVFAVLVEALYVAIIGGAPGYGGALGLLIGIASNAGDLFESWVKRVFQRKNSGNLIPGHGGMLDRIDSLLFAAPVSLAVLLAVGSETIFGANL